MEEVAGVSKRIGIGIGIGTGTGTGTAVSRLLPMMREVERVESKQEGTNETRREETRRAIQLTKTYIICLA